MKIGIEVFLISLCQRIDKVMTLFMHALIIILWFVIQSSLFIKLEIVIFVLSFISDDESLAGIDYPPPQAVHHNNSHHGKLLPCYITLVLVNKFFDLCFTITWIYQSLAVLYNAISSSKLVSEVVYKILCLIMTWRYELLFVLFLP